MFWSSISPRHVRLSWQDAGPISPLGNHDEKSRPMLSKCLISLTLHQSPPGLYTACKSSTSHFAFDLPTALTFANPGHRPSSSEEILSCVRACPGVIPFRVLFVVAEGRFAYRVTCLDEGRMERDRAGSSENQQTVFLTSRRERGKLKRRVTRRLADARKGLGKERHAFP